MGLFRKPNLDSVLQDIAEDVYKKIEDKRVSLTAIELKKIEEIHYQKLEYSMTEFNDPRYSKEIKLLPQNANSFERIMAMSVAIGWFAKIDELTKSENPKTKMPTQFKGQHPLYLLTMVYTKVIEKYELEPLSIA